MASVFSLYPGLSPAVDLEVASNAAGSLGFGAYFKGFWFAGPWAVSQQQQYIAYKELLPVVVAAHVWGPQWCKRHVLFRSGNEAVVHMLNSRTSKIPSLMQLLRNLLLSAARYSFSFSAQHIPGVFNQIADVFLVSVGRNFDSWPQVLSQPPHRFLPSSCRNSPVFSRTAVSHLPYAWPSPIHSQDLCNRSKEVLQLLSPARPASSLWVALSR